MSVEKYEIKKTLLGRYLVLFRCPHCRSKLRSHESEIHDQDTCPDCGKPFRVSSDAVREIEARKAESAAQKESKAAAKRKQRQQRRPQVAGAQAPQTTEDSAAVPQSSLQSPALMTCPNCAEEISAAADHCRYCGETLAGRSAATTRRANFSERDGPVLEDGRETGDGSRTNSAGEAVNVKLVVLIVVVGLFLVGLVTRNPPARRRQGSLDSERERLSRQASVDNRFIPGLAAVDVYGNLTDKGFELKKDFSDPEQAIWRCIERSDDHTMTVEVFGRSPTEIELVRATHLNHAESGSMERGREFIAYVGTLPYDGSQPNRAKTWIARKFGENVTKRFGEVEFELIANSPRVRMLLIRPHN